MEVDYYSTENESNEPIHFRMLSNHEASGDAGGSGGNTVVIGDNDGATPEDNTTPVDN